MLLTGVNFEIAFQLTCQLLTSMPLKYTWKPYACPLLLNIAVHHIRYFNSKSSSEIIQYSLLPCYQYKSFISLLLYKPTLVQSKISIIMWVCTVISPLPKTKKKRKKGKVRFLEELPFQTIRKKKRATHIGLGPMMFSITLISVTAKKPFCLQTDFPQWKTWFSA